MMAFTVPPKRKAVKKFIDTIIYIYTNGGDKNGKEFAETVKTMMGSELPPLRNLTLSDVLNNITIGDLLDMCAAGKQ